ncbi:PepSY-like domain-containing protein [Jiulongibacter sediminis]|jgi:hypothetical protein|uniref:PepSY-like domain-containing protein n=1 Tax=Jiulongibacter sediminis TaxID=1605367 RepID=UPI0026F37B37|nr:PepSY-like domain-containing protein [Jiulongibacter sediminis]
MRHLKFVWAFLLAAPLAFTSCESLNLGPDAAAGDSAMLDMLFFATNDDSTGVVRGHRGHCNITEVAVEDLSATITDYISANYADATIDRAGTNDETGYTMVKITLADGTHAGLIFDADGNFLEEKTHKGKGTAVDVADLPTAITDYISTNYADATIEKARLHDDGSYGVLILQSDDTYLGVGFDADSNFVSEFNMKDKGGKKHGKGGHKGGGH